MSRKEVISSEPARLIACQEALALFGRFALQSNDLGAILNTACEQVAHGLNVPISKIAVALPGKHEMRLQAAVGIPPSAGIPGETMVPADDGSAMGYAVLVGEPVISTVDTETRFQPSEVVRKSGVRSSVNVVIWTAEEPFGVLEADSFEPDVFGEHDIRFLQLYANLIGAAVERQRLTARAEDLAAQREVLLKESVHRIKNVLSVVQAIASRTKKDAGSFNEFFELLSGRIGALARLQDMTLIRGEGSVSFGDLVRAEISISGAKEGEQFELEGPSLSCPLNCTQPLSLLFYELTTNACKYGALRPDAPEGAQIKISWRIQQQGDGSEQLEIHWKERGTKRKTRAQTKGFGSELLREALPRMLGGTTDITIGESEVNCVVRFSLQN